MNDNPFDRPSAMTPVIVEDLFLTDVFLIKGRMAKKSRRLSDVLEDYSRTFLHVADATMVSLRTRDVIRTPSLLINTGEILLAHELIELGGDEVQRRLATKKQRTSKIRAFYNGATQFELSGMIEPSAYEANASSQRRHFILEQPQFRGLDLKHPEMSVLGSLDYAIVRRDRLAYIYDFGG
ncbi:MAG: hypothetical protein RL398_474 [Planctomycetota bacterium]|jgi:hypothetical protein